MIARSALILLAVCLAYAGTFELRGMLATHPVVFDDANALLQGRSALAAGDLIDARRWIQQSLEHRPLYAPAWMDIAEVEQRLGNREPALHAAQTAVELWPYRVPLLSRAARFFPLIGCVECSIAPLERLLTMDPPRSTRALALLRSMGVTDGELQQIIRESTASLQDIEQSVRRIVIALTNAAEYDFALSMVGARDDLSETVVETILDGFIRTTYQRSAVNTYCQAVRLQTGESCIPPPNSDRWNQISPLGLPGWQSNAVKGAAVKTDRATIQVEFDGTENLNFSHLYLLAPLSQQQSRLSGRWKGDKISTRSGVFLELRLRCGEQMQTQTVAEMRYGSWDWQEFTADIFDGECGFAELFVRRQATNNLDRLFSGRVEIGNITMGPPTL